MGFNEEELGFICVPASRGNLYRYIYVRADVRPDYRIQGFYCIQRHHGEPLGRDEMVQHIL